MTVQEEHIFKTCFCFVKEIHINSPVLEVETFWSHSKGMHEELLQQKPAVQYLLCQPQKS